MQINNQKIEREISWPDIDLAQVKIWDDLYSRLDPVPNGPLMEFHTPSKLKTHELSNTENVLTDHTSYWSNSNFKFPIIERIRSAGFTGKHAPLDVKPANVSYLKKFGFRSLAILVTVGWPLALIGSETTLGEFFALIGLPEYSYSDGIRANLAELESYWQKFLAMLHWASGTIAFCVVYFLLIFLNGRWRKSAFRPRPD